MFLYSKWGCKMGHGGVRTGAGRPSGKGKFKEVTKTVRLPVSRITEVMAYLEQERPTYKIPLYACAVKAGFPSPADDHIDISLDLNEHLIKHPAATFFVRASGDSMLNAGIHSGDILIVDRSLDATHGKIVIVALNGELTVKRLWKSSTQTKLIAENADFPAITITDEHTMVIWGVVTNVIHQL